MRSVCLMLNRLILHLCDQLPSHTRDNYSVPSWELDNTLVINSDFRKKTWHLWNEVFPCLSRSFWKGWTAVLLHCHLIVKPHQHNGSYSRCLVTRPRWAKQINISSLQRTSVGGNWRIHKATVSPHCDEEELWLSLLLFARQQWRLTVLSVLICKNRITHWMNSVVLSGVCQERMAYSRRTLFVYICVPCQMVEFVGSVDQV